MDFILRVWAAAIADQIAYFFCAVILGAFIFGVAILPVPSWRRSRLSAYLPTFMTTLGLLGTFLGVLIGLLDFNVEDIDASVPSLLAGLKIAFITSIFGIMGSVMLRLMQALFPSGGIRTGVTPGDIYAVLTSLRQDGAAHAERMETSLDRVKDAIAAEGDGSLISQIQKLRTEQRDGQKELISEFRDFARHMTENNQKALIEALKEVISDFNNNLTEQFGENFKELNAAVHKLVEWQEKYRGHIEEMEARVAAAVLSLENTEQSLANVEAHARAIPENMTALEPIMQGLKTQTAELEQLLGAISDLGKDALQAFPTIERNLELITKELAKQVQAAIERNEEALERHTVSYRQLEAGFQQLQSAASDAQATFNAEMGRALDAVNAQLLQTVSKHGDLIEATAREANKIIDESWNRTGEQIDRRMDDFDKQMQEEMKRALELMGQRLASISEKFAEDYTPLANKLQRIVHMASGVQV